MDTWAVFHFVVTANEVCAFFSSAPEFISGWDLLYGFHWCCLPVPIYVISFFPPHMQVKYKADLKKLHKPVTDMKESLIMNHVLNTSHLASSVSLVVCCRNGMFHPFAAELLCWARIHLLCSRDTRFTRKLFYVKASFQVMALVYQLSMDCDTSQNVKKLLFLEYLIFLFSNWLNPSLLRRT